MRAWVELSGKAQPCSSESDGRAGGSLARDPPLCEISVDGEIRVAL